MATAGARARRAAAASVAVLAVASTGTGAAAARAPGCAAVGAVFARGSGQPLGHREAPRFFEKLGARLGPEVSLHAYELGSEIHGGARYPAAGVGGDTAQEILNVLDARAGVAGGTYRASVDVGATELAAYLTGRAAACPGERLVVGGYSQGAQVVGDGLARLSAPVRDRVSFVALFGDPRLHLPEGRGVVPPACLGAARSSWRRGNVGCFTDNGILGARQPYLPAALVARTGSWCDRGDPICNGNAVDLARSTHSRYAEPGQGMDAAVAEAVARVR